jgi:cysteine desulfurase / selenocysteine lyase
MQLSKKLVTRHRCERNDTSLISGCESLAWLSIECSAQYSTGTGEECSYTIYADSDAKVIRGLLVIIIAAYNNKSAQYIQEFDIQAYFEQLGLLQHLSPSRGNGVWAIVNKIKQLSTEITG